MQVSISVIFQNYANYHFPVKTSISIGKTQVPFDFEKVKAAATSSAAEAFIAAWQPFSYQGIIAWNRNPRPAIFFVLPCE